MESKVYGLDWIVVECGWMDGWIKEEKKKGGRKNLCAVGKMDILMREDEKPR